jgi:nucleoside-diphosphate-sugar epimerase
MTDKAWSLEKDLEDILQNNVPIWHALKGASIFMTGGTGFIGCWLLEALRHADLALGLGIHVTVLTRHPDSLKTKAPHLAAYPGFRFMGGDVSNFEFPEEQFSHLVHAATDASAHLNETNPVQMFETVVQGTRHTLDFAVARKIERVLYLSSGAVYGQQPWTVEKVGEDWLGAPDCTNPKNTYAEAKRAAEMLVGIYRKQFGLQIATARIFALLGPYLSLDIHFAAGNFILDAMRGKPVVVQGNGKPVRSYLYAADLTTWLLQILVRAPAGKFYNVGSDEGVSIASLAERTAKLLGDGKFRVLGAPDRGWNPGRYVPRTDLVVEDLGLYRTVSLDEAILRTALWNGWQR